MVLDFLPVGNFDFTRKIVKKFWAKNSWGFVKILCFSLDYLTDSIRITDNIVTTLVLSTFVDTKFPTRHDVVQKITHLIWRQTHQFIRGIVIVFEF